MQLMVSMGKGALVLEFALAEELPVPAHLSLELDLVRLHKVVSLLVTMEKLLRLFDCCLLVVFVGGTIFSRGTRFRDIH